MSEWKRPESVPFPSVWARFEGRKEVDGTKRRYWIQDITDEYLEDVVECMSKKFVREEPLCKYSGFCEDEECMEDFAKGLRRFLSQKIGLVCLTKNDEGLTEISGINCTYVSLQNRSDDEEKPEKCKRVIEACFFMIEAVDLFKTFGVDKFVTAMGLYVPHRFRGEGIGEVLLRAREHLCRAIGVRVTGTIFTSATSQILAERVGYKDFFSISYEAFQRVDENFVFPGIEEAAKNIRFMYLLYDE